MKPCPPLPRPGKKVRLDSNEWSSACLLTSLRHVTLRNQRPAHRRLTSPMTPPTIPDRSGRAPTGAEGGDTQVSITIFFMHTRTRTRTGNAHTHTRIFTHIKRQSHGHLYTHTYVHTTDILPRRPRKWREMYSQKTLVRLVSQPDASEILTSQDRRGKKSKEEECKSKEKNRKVPKQTNKKQQIRSQRKRISTQNNKQTNNREKQGHKQRQKKK